MFANISIAEFDPELAQAIASEGVRQEAHIELIASEKCSILISCASIKNGEKNNIIMINLIINILDERILRSVSTFGAYSVSKLALAHLTELSAVSWGETIRVNGIAPGLILPPSGSPDEYLINNASNIPTKTHGNTSDILRGFDYILDSPFVNGEILFIDGGESKKR